MVQCCQGLVHPMFPGLPWYQAGNDPQPPANPCKYAPSLRRGAAPLQQKEETLSISLTCAHDMMRASPLLGNIILLMGARPDKTGVGLGMRSPRRCRPSRGGLRAT